MKTYAESVAEAVEFRSASTSLVNAVFVAQELTTKNFAVAFGWGFFLPCGGLFYLRQFKLAFLFLLAWLTLFFGFGAYMAIKLNALWPLYFMLVALALQFCLAIYAAIITGRVRAEAAQKLYVLKQAQKAPVSEGPEA